MGGVRKVGEIEFTRTISYRSFKVKYGVERPVQKSFVLVGRRPKLTRMAMGVEDGGDDGAGVCGGAVITRKS